MNRGPEVDVSKRNSTKEISERYVQIEQHKYHRQGKDADQRTDCKIFEFTFHKLTSRRYHSSAQQVKTKQSDIKH